MLMLFLSTTSRRYTKKDIPKLVESTLPQARVLVLAPGYENNEEGRHQLSGILENSMSF